MPRRRKTDDATEALKGASVSKSEDLSNPTEWLSAYKASHENDPTFTEWYMYMSAYNNSKGLGEPSFKQWYSLFTTLKDKTKKAHPHWFALGAHENHNSLCDSSLESPQQEFEKLFKEYLKNSEEK